MLEAGMSGATDILFQEEVEEYSQEILEGQET